MADDEPNDRWGNSCYVLLIPAPTEIIEALGIDSHHHARPSQPTSP